MKTPNKLLGYIWGARPLLALVLVFATWLRFAPAVQAADVCNVGANRPIFKTIQAAVNNFDCLTISVDAGTYTENVKVNRRVRITGATSGSTIVDGNNAGSVFYILAPVTLSNLTIQHGSGNVLDDGQRYGGGILNYDALTVNNSTLTLNSAQSGGGIVNYATLTMNNSTLKGNSASADGGGIVNYATLTVNNSTLSDNRASAVGGGIANNGTRTGNKSPLRTNPDANLGTLTVSNSTFSGNSAADGGGLYSYAGTVTLSNSTLSRNGATGKGGGFYNASGSKLTLTNNILANSPAGGVCYSDTAITSHNNLIEDAAPRCMTSGGLGADLVGRAAKLGPLQVNAPGNTATYALLMGSPAIDAGNDSVCNAAPVSGLDQRGFARNKGAHCDIGAYEADPTSAPLVTVSFTPPSQYGWFTKNPATGSVTADGLASITDIFCENATVSNKSGLGTASASATLTINQEGTTRVICRALDSVGNKANSDGTQYTLVKLDTTAPDTLLTSQPPAASTSTTASFGFSGTDRGSSGVANYECQLDGGSFAPCTSPQSYSGLSLGAHSFAVLALDGAGNQDATPASYTWTISTLIPAPSVTVSFSPNGQNGWFTINPAIGSVSADSQAGIADIACENATVSNQQGLGTTSARATVAVNQEGMTQVKCQAIDSRGQVGLAVGVFVSVDTLAPTTRLTEQPANPTTSTAARFSFNSDNSDNSGLAGYQCALDGAGFTGCMSPQNYSNLSNGSHTFQVRASDNAGNVAAIPASYPWTINAPTVTGSATPNGQNGSREEADAEKLTEPAGDAMPNVAVHTTQVFLPLINR